MTGTASSCAVCGIPQDAGVFDEAGVHPPPLALGEEVELARYRLHPQYCGVLSYFAQLAQPRGAPPLPPLVETPGLHWILLCNQQPRDPYLPTSLILNPWGFNAFPMHIRLEEGCEVRLIVKRVPPPAGRSAVELETVAGRIQGRYWYNAGFGGRN